MISDNNFALHWMDTQFMTGKSLRTLAKEYASGIISKDDYRSARNKLLEGIVKGEVVVKAIDFRPPVKNQDLDTTQEKTTIRPAEAENDITAITIPDKSPVRQVHASTPVPDPEPREKSGSPYLLISIIVLVIAIIAIFSIIDLSKDEEQKIVVPSTPLDQVADVNLKEEEEIISPVVGKTPAETLIEEFLAENDWSESNLQAFEQEWNNLTVEEQRLGLESPLKFKLSNAIYQKLTEERALLGLGDSEAVIARQHTLVNFASALAIEDPRLTVETE